MSTSAPVWIGLLALAPLVTGDDQEDPPARALSRELCAAPRLAGTIGSEWGARLVRRHLEAAGFEVEFDRREVLLSLPRRIEISAWDTSGERMRALGRTRRFDADARPPGDVPPFNAWSASARARGPIVDVGRGLRADFERLAAEGLVEPTRTALNRLRPLHPPASSPPNLSPIRLLPLKDAVSAPYRCQDSLRRACMVF